MSSKIRTGNEWKPLLKHQNDREGYAMVAVGSKRIAIVGGDIEGGRKRVALDVIDIYDLEKKNWSSFKMKKERTNCTAAAVDEKLFIFGGMNELNGSVTSYETYDLSDRSSELHFLPPPMAQEKIDSSAVVYDKTNVVVMGGWTNYQASAKVEMLDTINNTWLALPSMPTARSCLAVGVAGTNIIAAGGCILNNHKEIWALDVVEILDMKTRRWKQAANMIQPRFSSGSAVVMDHSTNSYHMVIANGLGQKIKGRGFGWNRKVFSFTNESWSTTLPNLKSIRGPTKMVAMDGRLVAGDETGLETLDLEPNLMYKLVHFFVELDLHFSCKKVSSTKPSNPQSSSCEGMKR